MPTLQQEALKLHKDNQGKLGVYSKVAVENADDLSLAYSPGVAEPCLEIAKNEKTVYDYTNKGNAVAVVSNGTAVLGLGNIGAKASMPVMEGKAVLFKSFANIDAYPICLETEDTDKIVEIVKTMQAGFGGVNLEDIGAPACFEIEERLKAECDIPVFHDDQHGTAIVTAAGLLNAFKLAEKEASTARIVINGAGAAGISIVKLLLNMGMENLILCDRSGAIYTGREKKSSAKQEIARITNKENLKGSLAEVLKGADVFIGVSGANCVTKEMVESMNENPIIFAMANPDPEISVPLAKEAGALVVGTGRSDFPNQVNNVLAFPGIFRGALDARATDINEEMKIAAVYALADLIDASELNSEYVIPKPFDERVPESIAKAVYQAAIQSGVSRL